MNEEDLEKILSIVIEDTTEQSEQLRKYIYNLRNKVNNAIEFIENEIDYYDGKIPDDIEDIPFQYAMKTDIDELLNILKCGKCG